MRNINETPIIHDRHLVKEAYERMKLNGMHKNAFSMPVDLTMVLVRNEGSLFETGRIIPHLSGYDHTSILESNLNYLGIEGYEVLSKTIPKGEDTWVWTNKIKWILEFLREDRCKTEYILYCDPIDVIFQDSPTKVVDIFKQSECDLLFMSTKDDSSYSCMPEVKQWADSDFNRRGRYLNAGIFIGRTDFVREFLEESLKYCTDDDCTIGNWPEYMKSNPLNFPIGASDQCIFRYLEPKFYPRLKVDYENKMAFRS